MSLRGLRGAFVRQGSSFWDCWSLRTSCCRPRCRLSRMCRNRSWARCLATFRMWLLRLVVWWSCSVSTSPVRHCFPFFSFSFPFILFYHILLLFLRLCLLFCSASDTDRLLSLDFFLQLYVDVHGLSRNLATYTVRRGSATCIAYNILTLTRFCVSARDLECSIRIRTDDPQHHCRQVWQIQRDDPYCVCERDPRLCNVGDQEHGRGDHLQHPIRIHFWCM